GARSCPTPGSPTGSWRSAGRAAVWTVAPADDGVHAALCTVAPACGTVVRAAGLPPATSPARSRSCGNQSGASTSPESGSVGPGSVGPGSVPSESVEPDSVPRGHADCDADGSGSPDGPDSSDNR